MTDTVERLARIEGSMEAMKTSQERIAGFLERSVQERTAQHTETVKQLAVIENNQQSVKDDLKDYQKSCTDDRKDLTDQLDALKIHNAHQTGKNMGIAACISTIIAMLGIGIEWIKK